MSINAILGELEVESATTRRVLERVPSDKLTWKPHPKSMSLGELALHVARSPGYIAEGWACQDTVDFGKGGGSKPPEPTSTQEILAAHDEGVVKTKNALNTIGDAGTRSAVVGDDERRAGVQHAESGAHPFNRDEPYLPSPRTVVGVSASARRLGSVDLRAER